MSENLWTWEEYGEKMQKFVTEFGDCNDSLIAKGDTATDEDLANAGGRLNLFVMPVFLPLLDYTFSQLGVEPIKQLDDRLCQCLHSIDGVGSDFASYLDGYLHNPVAIGEYNMWRWVAGKTPVCVEEINANTQRQWTVYGLKKLLEDASGFGGVLDRRRRVLLYGNSSDVEDVAEDPMMQFLFDQTAKQQRGDALVRDVPASTSEFFGHFMSTKGNFTVSVLQEAQQKMLAGDKMLMRACAIYVAQAQAKGMRR